MGVWEAGHELPRQQSPRVAQHFGAVVGLVADEVASAFTVISTLAVGGREITIGSPMVDLWLTCKP